ncbi:hypothetical protein MHIR_DE00385 [Candidatus Doolittlea endobia]|uniref:Uncharacterized protein n=1 Tax=Candidatus Doolittlea endobia TaxID=1778262 RepID=A0A143WSL4_9ENTR|nr:hypothetical protein MHIR_DE00385 [Candidatus Doolittlea endobia]
MPCNRVVTQMFTLYFKKKYMVALFVHVESNSMEFDVTIIWHRELNTTSICLFKTFQLRYMRDT